MVGDVVQVVDGYGNVQQIIGKNIKILLSGRYGDGEWYTLGQVLSHAALSPKWGINNTEKFPRLHTRKTLMITTIEYVQVFALITGCAFIAYIVHEIGNAIHSMLND